MTEAQAVHQPLGLVTTGPEVATGCVDPREFRHVMGRFATGVAVITALHGEEPCGMTANSLTSVSLQPAMILVSVARDAHTGAAILRTGRFVVNVLHEHQEELSRRFAGSSEAKFEGVAVTSDGNGLIYLSQCLAHLICRVRTIVPAGDHDVVFADVDEARAVEGSPLVFYVGRYHRLPEEAA